MSESSQKAFIEAMVPYPESDDDNEITNDVEANAIFRSSTIDLLDNIGKSDFRFNYHILIKDIETASFNNQQIFCHNVEDRISEVYDFVFPTKIEIISPKDITNFLEFLKFLEYDNEIFLSFVWQHLNVDLLKIDIESFCNTHQNKILKEAEEQIETHEQNELTLIFIRTYCKSKFIKWFIRQSEMNKVSVMIRILEREGRLNG